MRLDADSVGSSRSLLVGQEQRLDRIGAEPLNLRCDAAGSVDDTRCVGAGRHGGSRGFGAIRRHYRGVPSPPAPVGVSLAVSDPQAANQVIAW